MTADATGPKHLNLTISKAKLESICDDFLKKTIKPCENCIKDSGVSKEKIDEVLLVGGSTRMPKVNQFLFLGLRVSLKILRKNPK